MRLLSGDLEAQQRAVPLAELYIDNPPLGVGGVRVRRAADRTLADDADLLAARLRSERDASTRVDRGWRGAERS